MKSINLFILSLIVSGSFILSCESSKSSQKSSENMIEKISMEKITMGSNAILEITKDQNSFTERQRDGSSKETKGEISTKSWNEINRLVSKLDLTKMDQWEGPTQTRFYDGAKATTIIIESNGQTFNSQGFDEGRPPAELSELYNYLESLVNQ